MSVGWWTTTFLFALPITFILSIIYGGYLAFKQESRPSDPNKYRS